MRVIQFLKDWTLIIAMAAGIGSYFIYVNIPWLNNTHQAVMETIGIIQPALIFIMLFLTFTRINPRELRLRPWMGWLILFQSGCFCAIGSLLVMMPHSGLRVILEGAMLCLICPTATAAAVITRRLGGEVRDIATYTVLINLVVALLVPALIPFVHPSAGMSALHASLLILCKVFPLLLFPMMSAWGLKLICPRAIEWLGRWQWLSFYIWAVALSLALTVTTRSVIHSSVPLQTQAWLVAVSLITCVVQFWLGRKIGAQFGEKTTAGQALGQKNTVLAIWMGYTFFTPVTAVVGGFYSIWHNIANSWQLYRNQHPHKEPNK